HAEVDRLPDRFRRPVLLCYLEGRPSKEAARLLGCPPGTLKCRLAKGREILRRRLARRRAALTAAFLLLILPAPASAETGPRCVTDATVEEARRRPRRRHGAGVPPAFDVARVGSTATGVMFLTVSTFAWVLFQPSPARGTWVRWLQDLAHKVCQ